MAEPRFLAACRGRSTDAVPVWFMRQAGRYLPEYRAIRQQYSVLEICHTPELAAEVAVQPVERLRVDAGIMFADILLPFEPLRLGVTFADGEGPIITRPIRRAADVRALPTVDPERDLSYVLQAVGATKRVLASRAPGVPLIGFAGAPFTLASYAIEGGATRSFEKTKQFMYEGPDAWHALLKKLAELVGHYLAAQAGAGADALQLFDSWVGCLAPEDYQEYVLPHSRRAVELAQTARVPVIHFGTDTATLLGLMAEAGSEVIGVDWRIPLDDAWRRIGSHAIQGNLDPAALFASPSEIERRVRDILRRAGGRPGHIFNLGHGVLPNTPVDHLEAVVRLVHRFR